ncbi:tetratricopeptide repeat protein [Pendulispora rubella]|uniref:Tetratricopeptide repeat protein n=1 Tax=Pendulispora rubella TaxID=2741070 RepID=A0ABZ2LH50_9BACT
MDERLKQVLLLGREHYAKRDFEKAEELLREVLSASEDRFADVHDMLGVICHSRGNYVQAERHFERALSINPAYTEAALNLAVTYNDRGKYDAAREVYTRIKGSPMGTVQTLDPFARGKLANMHADLAQAYADLGLTREAIGELEKGVTLCPTFADLRTRLGNMLHHENDLEAARVQYEAAVGARPEYVPARVKLGVTLLALGLPNDAEDAWQRALAIEPDNAQAKMYLRMLQQTRSKESLRAMPVAKKAPGSG